MSIFGSIMSKIFGHQAAAAPASVEAPSASTAAPSPAANASPDVSSQPVVDVGSVLTDLASKSGQSLNWRTSIVDLMKLLGLDSSLDHRKELAKELNFTGDTADSASMNVWLHKQVMQKLAENGGKVPSDLVS